MTDGGARRALVFVHVSDLHFREAGTPLAEREAALRDKLLDDVTSVVALASGELEAILLTGDIARSGQVNEYLVAREWLNVLCGRLGLHPTKTLTVPGNHDIDWTRLDDERQALNQALRTCDVHLLDGKIDQLLLEPDKVLAPLEPYQEFAAGYACDIAECLAWNLPNIDLGEGYSLAIRGANSVINSDRGDDKGTMAVQLNQLLTELKPGVLRLLMLHHSPHFWHRPNPTPAECGHHLVLYGHTHKQEHHFDGATCLEVTAGAVHPEEHECEEVDGQPLFAVPGYNVIELSIESIARKAGTADARVRIWHREFSREHQRFLDSGPEPSIDERIEITMAIDQGGVAQPVGAHVDADVAEMQPPLEGTTGEPDPTRLVLIAYEGLGSGDRLRVMRQLGLPTDEFASLQPHKQIRAAARMVVSTGLVDAFLAKVGEIEF